MMNWIDNFFFCAATMGAAGSIGCVLFVLFRGWLLKRRPELGLYLVKTILLLFLIPFIYVGLRVSRLVYGCGEWIHVGWFGAGTSPRLVSVVEKIGVVWLVGLAAGIFVRIRHYMKIREMLRDNVPVTEDFWYVLQDEACESYPFDKVLICQNKQVHTPFVVNSVRAIVVLPFLNYTDKQMRMVMDHELNHVRGKDLLWRKVALVVSWLHWYNPFAYLVIDWLNEEQEIRCDIESCQNTRHYTPDEYFGFMLSLTGGMKNNSFVAALVESSALANKRIEAFRTRKKMGKPNRYFMVLVSALFTLAAAVPAYAMSEQAAKLEEEWLTQDEIIVMEEAGTQEGLPIQQMMDDKTVIEKQISEIDEGETYQFLKTMAEPGVRYLASGRILEEGDQLWITAAGVNEDVRFLTGIKNIDTGEIWYVEAVDSVMQIFEIQQLGTYDVFFVNQSDSEIKFEGVVLYVQDAT